MDCMATWVRDAASQVGAVNIGGWDFWVQAERYRAGTGAAPMVSIWKRVKATCVGVRVQAQGLRLRKEDGGWGEARSPRVDKVIVRSHSMRRVL